VIYISKYHHYFIQIGVYENKKNDNFFENKNNYRENGIRDFEREGQRGVSEGGVYMQLLFCFRLLFLFFNLISLLSIFIGYFV
jgi:hypothetical protein